MKLEQIAIDMRLRGLVPGRIVIVTQVRPAADDAFVVVFTLPDGSLQERVVRRADERALAEAQPLPEKPQSGRRPRRRKPGSDIAQLSKADIGRIGEAVFHLLCAQAGLDVTAVQRDINGWDALVEVPMEPRSLLPFEDDHEAPKRFCKVQVKTTTRGDRPRISLSNWKYMVCESVPWFVVHIELDGTCPVTVSVAHIDRVAVEGALDRIDKAETSGKKLSAAKPHIVALLDEDELDQPWPASLRDRLRRCLGQEAVAYAQAKAEWVASAGYDSRSFTFNFEFLAKSAPEAAEAFVKFLTGESHELRIENSSFSVRRFGRTRPAGSITLDRNTIFRSGVDPTAARGAGGAASICLFGGDIDSRVEVPCEFFLGSAYYPLPPHADRLRIVTDQFSIVRHFEGEVAVWTMSMTPLPANRNVSLRTASIYARISTLLSTGQPLTLSLGRAGNLQLFATKVALTLDSHAPCVSHAAQRLALVAARIGVDMDTFVSLDEVDDCSYDIDILYGALIDPSPTLAHELPPVPDGFPQGALEGLRLLTPTWFVLGGYVFSGLADHRVVFHDSVDQHRRATTLHDCHLSYFDCRPATQVPSALACLEVAVNGAAAAARERGLPVIVSAKVDRPRANG